MQCVDFKNAINSLKDTLAIIKSYKAYLAQSSNTFAEIGPPSHSVLLDDDLPLAELSTAESSNSSCVASAGSVK